MAEILSNSRRDKKFSEKESEILNKVLNLDIARILLIRSNLEIKDKNYNDAVIYLKVLLSIFPNNEEGLSKLARVYLLKGNIPLRNKTVALLSHSIAAREEAKPRTIKQRIIDPYDFYASLDLAKAVPTPEDALIKKEIQQVISNKIAQLADKIKDPDVINTFRLKTLEGLSFREIAERLYPDLSSEKSVNRVRSNYYYYKKRLLKLLMEDQVIKDLMAAL